MYEFSWYRSEFLVFRGLSEASFLAAGDTRSRAWFLTISMKVFIKSWKSTEVDRSGLGAGEPRTDTSGFGVGMSEFKPASLGTILS